MKLIKKLLIIHLLWMSALPISYALPTIRDWNTEEGARVLYAHAPELPMLDIRISIPTGRFHEKAQYGLADMTANLFTRGTKKLNEEEILEILENFGASISADTSISQSIISYRSLSGEPFFKGSFELLLDMIQNPRFDEKIFLRERDQTIDAQKALLDDINNVALELYLAKLYPNQFLGTTSIQLQEALKRLTIADIRSFQQKNYHATGAKIVILGDVDLKTAKEISASISKALGKGTPSPKVDESLTPTSEALVTQHFNSPQSKIFIGHPSITQFEADFFPLIVGNHVLGGSGLTSLLMMDIREKQGLTYGISSNFNPSFLHGPFTIALSTKNENVDHAISETKKLVEGFIQNGPDDESLLRAQNNLSGTTILNLDSNTKIISALLFLATYDLPLDYYDTYPEKVKAVTKEEIQAAFAKHIHPNKMVTVIVGGDQK